MTKKKQVHKTPEEVKDTLAEEAEQRTNRECAKEVEEVLRKYGRALQPFLQYSEQATVPRVRLVSLPDEADVEEAA